MRTFTFKLKKSGSIDDCIQEFMFVLLLAGRIINRHYMQSTKIARWIDLQEDYFKAGFYSGDTANNGANFSFSLSDGILIVTTKTGIAEGITACLDKAQGSEKNWKQVLMLIYVLGTVLSEGTLDDDIAH